MDRKRVLIVEDNELNRKLVRTLLQIANYESLETSNAEEALKIVRETRPDLVLMDIHLPGMDGLTATKQMKKDPELRDIPVVALTACAMPDDKQKALDAGCEGYISKPIETRNFVERLNSFMKPASIDKREEEKCNRSKKILIVDDNDANIKLLMAKLSKDNYHFLTATNGHEALAEVERNSPDLVLLDIMMPGMDGFEVTELLKNNPATRDIPVILVTALEDEKNKVRGLRIGADDFLNKPVNTVELRARVKSLLKLKDYKERLTAHSKCEEKILTKTFSAAKSGNEASDPLIVLVEDEKKDAKLIMEYLDGLPYRVKWLKDAHEVFHMIKEEKIDLIILDILLPRTDGFEVCKILKSRLDARNIQILILTNLRDLESKIKSIELGADEYIMKPVNKHELRVRVRALMNKKAYLDKLCEDYECAFSSAIKDKLTGLYNRNYLDHYLEIELKRCKRHRSTLSLIMIDIDDFKIFNDKYGHLAGDDILRHVGETIKRNIREVDTPARYGGEEFVVVLPDEDLENALKISERLMEALRNDFAHQSGKPPGGLTVSMGIATYPGHGQLATSLLNAAYRALYNAKKSGKNRICVAGSD